MSVVFCDHRNALARQNDVAALRDGWLRIVPAEPVRIWTPDTVDWTTGPQSSRAWHMFLHSLSWLEALIASSAEDGGLGDLELARRLAGDWVATHPLRPKNEGPWHDHATSIRALTLVCLHAQGTDDSWLKESLTTHGEVLRDEKRYAGPYNHGINQDLSLIAVGWTLGNDEWIDFAVRRLGSVAATSVSTNGVLDEQAPEYSNYLWGLWNRAIRYIEAVGREVPNGLDERLARMPEFMAHASMPDGRYAQFGDSFHRAPVKIPGTDTEYVHTRGGSGRRPEQTHRVYEEGYAFGRSGWGDERPFDQESYYAVRFGPERARHGHHDHTSFVYVAAGREVVVDSGHSNYQRDAYRDHLVSAAAHNVVECVDPARERNTSTRLVSSSVEGQVATLELTDEPYDGITRTRRLTFMTDWDVVVVNDLVTAGEPAFFRQLTHLAPDLDVRREGARVAVGVRAGEGDPAVRIVELANPASPHPVDVRRGAENPLLGWISRDVDRREAAPVVVHEALGRTVEFLTVIHCRPGTTATVREDGVARWLEVAGDDRGRRVDLLERPPATGPHAVSDDSSGSDGRLLTWPDLAALDFTASGDQPARHRVDGEGLPLDAYYRPGRGPLLTVTFHGRLDRREVTVPHFEWQRRSEAMPGSVLLLADPTMHVHEKVRLGWYLGTEDYDPERALCRIIQRAAEAAGARQVLFTGRSGGGFAALRFGALFPGSLVLPLAPQVDLFAYYRSWLAELMGFAFPSYDRESARRMFRDRWSVTRLYREGAVTGRVRYVQSAGDAHHMANHLALFSDVAGVRDGTTADGAISVVTEASTEATGAAARDAYWAHYRELLAVGVPEVAELAGRVGRTAERQGLLAAARGRVGRGRGSVHPSR